MRALLLLAALLAPAIAHAETVALSSAVFVEREVKGSDGRARTVLEPPGRVTPGDRLVFLLGYRNTSVRPAADFVVTNPMPASVAFQGTPDGNAVVSVDGGRAWGRLPALRVRERDGSLRGARPEDVTHVRWSLGRAIPAGQAGKLSFRGVVR